MNDQSAGASRNAITSLVLGILGIICCGLLAIPATLMGKAELAAVDSGASPAAGRTLAQIGMILGIIGCVFLVLQLVYLFAMGGLAVLMNSTGGRPG